MSSKYDAICDGATRVFAIRTTNTFVENIGLGILCGICVFIAVAGYARNSHPITVMLPVAIFVFCGFNHCVADMFYFVVSGKIFTLESQNALAATTIGNFLGCAVPVMLMNIDVRTTAS
jgi:formate/nitrite transporter FocA (FNT family)